MKKARDLSQVAFLVIGLVTCAANGALYQMAVFTDNGNYYDDPAVDIYIDVLPQGDQIRFEVHNDSDKEVGSCVAQLYFDDDSLLLDAIADIEEGPGTSFDIGGSPPDLPAGQSLPTVFDVTEGFMVSADNPAPTHSVNPGEWMAVIFDLVSGDFFDVLDAMDDESLRIGAHVISFADGSSEGVITPEPGTILLLLSGLALLKRKSF